MVATEDWAGFYRLLPEDRYSPGKDLTFPIEASNSDIRHRLARFTRRTKAPNRSLNIVLASPQLTHHLQDDGTLQSHLNPFLSIFS